MGINSGVPVAIWLVIELWGDIKPLSIVTKFHEDPMETTKGKVLCKSFLKMLAW